MYTNSLQNEILYYRVSSIKRRLLINAGPPIHAGWQHNCKLINAASPTHSGPRGRVWQILKVAAHMLVSSYLMPVQIASGGRITFQVGSCKTAQGRHKEKLLLVPGAIM